MGLIAKNFVKNIFIYIQSGVFKGELHQYEKDVCILTGETKNEILQKEYTDADVNELLQFIIKKKMTKLYMGGSIEDIDQMTKMETDLIDEIDLDELKRNPIKIYRGLLISS